mgnify:CR=1 FL=1
MTKAELIRALDALADDDQVMIGADVDEDDGTLVAIRRVDLFTMDPPTFGVLILADKFTGK